MRLVPEEIADTFVEDAVLIVNVSGRGDKDVNEVARLEGVDLS